MRPGSGIISGLYLYFQVFLYVMHAKKAGVTEEELARIKQRQQQAHRQQLLATQRPSELHTPQGRSRGSWLIDKGGDTG